MGHYTGMQRDDLLLRARDWMNLTDVVLSERSQRERVQTRLRDSTDIKYKMCQTSQRLLVRTATPFGGEAGDREGDEPSLWGLGMRVIRRVYTQVKIHPPVDLRLVHFMYFPACMLYLDF